MFTRKSAPQPDTIHTPAGGTSLLVSLVLRRKKFRVLTDEGDENQKYG